MSLPFTIDGTEIDPAAPRSEMTDDEAAQIVDAAETFRETVLHCHYDLVGRVLTVTASNVPGETVAFTFGDGSADVVEPISGGQASTEHTYLSDGVFPVTVYTDTDRWSTEVAINWPEPPPEEPA